MSKTTKVTISYLVSALVLFSSLFYHYFGPFWPLMTTTSSPTSYAWSPSPPPFWSSRPRVPVLFAVSTRGDRIRARKLVRATWKTLVPEGQARLHFFAGERQCPVDPYWRLKPGACAQWRVFVPASINEGFPVRPYRLQPSLVGASPPVDGIGFRLPFPLIVSQLGLSARALRQFVVGLPSEQSPKEAELRSLAANLTVELVEPGSEDVILSANFSSVELAAAQADDGFVYVPVREDTFGRGFEGVLRVIHSDRRGDHGLVLNQSLACNVVWNKMFGEDGLLPLTSVWTGGRASWPASTRACPLVTAVFSVAEMTELRQVVNSKDTQNRCQHNKNRNQAAKIVEELEDNDDFYLAPNVYDVEEERPLAFLSFLRHALENYDFDYVVASADNAFLAADRLTGRVAASAGGGALPEDFAWRGHFRRSPEVRRHGWEWPGAEPRYPGHYYPALPSAAGSVLTRAVAEYLARNAGSLTAFADLGSSLAVWLSPLDPVLVHDNDFSPDNLTCDSRTLAFGPLATERDMLHLWENYRSCRKLCSCEQPKR